MFISNKQYNKIMDRLNKLENMQSDIKKSWFTSRL